MVLVRLKDRAKNCVHRNLCAGILTFYHDVSWLFYIGFTLVVELTIASWVKYQVEISVQK